MGEIEQRLQEVLLPVFGLSSVDELPLDASLVNDIGADSLDFVEVVYLIDQHFGVALKPGEMVGAGIQMDADDFFVEGRLSRLGAESLQAHYPDSGDRFVEGMTKIDLFRSITVRDLAKVIQQRQSC